MANKMLIDAAHPEETRVVVVRGNRVEEFDFEAANKKQLRGNIYLAKVTRVEPSLQAAFVDYGGNRHGFLAFSEIHPDYYQIPYADRQALLAEEVDDEPAEEEVAEPTPAAAADAAEGEAVEGDGEHDHDHDHDHDDEHNGEDTVESVGAGDALEEVVERGSRHAQRRSRQYKIQEVIKRRQVLLVQVVKEERGNKGAALTTYLSLAGRYSVLMPNTARGGGISRKITSPADRKRLKTVVSDLSVPEGMGVILRTAGASRTKAEIKRDFEYLLRLWENVRELTLKSSAPMLVYEEGSLVKRSIRDLYNKDIDEVLVAGDDGYREAKDFMRMLMPSHARHVQPYKDSQPLFARHGVESQLDAMFSPQVTLRSGGYLVINQTEALVSIDVNSGRSTREHNIEDTALSTNLEAAEEIARQLRLRDLAGLIVIDFIDMEEKRNNRSVERKLKECLKNDRARIQVGRISHFGLLEMSRQRIRTGVLEGSTEVCPHCRGAGIVRSTESVALHVLRSLEDHLLKGVSHHLTVRTRTAVTLYILNQKRAHLIELEQRFGLTLSIFADDAINGQHFVVERGDPVTPREVETPTTIKVDTITPVDQREEEIEEPVASEETEDEGARRGKRRRRKRRRPAGDGQTRPEAADAAGDEAGEDADGGAEADGDGDGEESAADATEAGEPRKSRRRGRRGGRRSRRSRSGEAEGGEAEGVEADANEDGGEIEAAEAGEFEAGEFEAGEIEAGEDEPVAMIETTGAAESVAVEETVEAEAPAAEMEPASEPEDDGAPDDAADAGDGAAEAVEAEAEAEAEAGEPEDVAAPVETAEPSAAAEAEAAPAPAASEPEDDDPDRPKRSGWWQRRSFF
ncbi:MAG: ribonuclease E/G [Hyphomicrobiales bacterium]